ncbi:hypothetical protein BEL04_07185 [Mucilaginibacter sp. PPCGB 2223]|uniref:hypothetical protein n=1 Tax=Mucilaginibacter sp. PPCGB 2223 TaxID=1886027 RepID=UPI0008246911|nr:hypothetical protein [Mucilaginibacter sp. PPCGB 2223]OCX54051.1 hypothetical protein BEL04_07185 [Mucilaginibacter sp. PPCGB 2223]
MKKSLLPIFMGLGLCLVQTIAKAQHEAKEHISKEFTLTKGVVAVYNVFGSINVEGYSGNKVIMEIDQTISADDEATLAEGKKEFKLAFDEKADTVMAYIAAPFDSRPHTHYGDWENNHRRIEYKYKLNFTIKVPYALSLRISTINSGNILVKDVYGSLHINNVNGGIEIQNAKGATYAHTVNGPVTVNYLVAPNDDSSYYTINGAIKVTYPATLAANIGFKSMNGQFYTDFDDVEVLPGKVTKTEGKGKNGTTYRLNKDSEVKIGAGGKLFKFETLNGNIYIKKQQ